MKQLIFEVDNKGSDKTKYDVNFIQEESNNTRIILCQSQYDNSWTNPGQIDAELHDDGNGVTITLDNGQKIRLDYSQALAVRLLLHAEDMSNAKKHPALYPTTLNKFLPYKG